MKNAKILIGQRNSSLTDTLNDPIRLAGGEVEVVVNSVEVLARIKEGAPPDLIIIESGLIDPDSLQICRAVKSDPDLYLIPVLFIVTDGSSLDFQAVMEAGCDDIMRLPTDPLAILTRINSLLRFKNRIEELDDAESVLFTLTRTIEVKDKYTMGHADRVSRYAALLGHALGVNAFDLENLRKGGMLHDVGKVAIPDALLSKPGKYTLDEFEVMKKHPALGVEMCQKLRTVRHALPLIRHHHEKLDGSGYPDGLVADQIGSLVRVVTVVDIYDALRSKRSYKEAYPIDQSFQIMWDEAGKGWWDEHILSTWEILVRAQNKDPYSKF